VGNYFGAHSLHHQLGERATRPIAPLPSSLALLLLLAGAGLAALSRLASQLGRRTLKNAGYVPPEVEARRELHEASAVIKELDPASQEYLRALQKLRCLDVRLAEQRGFGLRAGPAYFRRLLQRLGGE
jgi:hypothetical protein